MRLIIAFLSGMWLLGMAQGCATQRDFDFHRSVERSITDAQTEAMTELVRLWEVHERRLAALEAKAKVCGCRKAPKAAAIPAEDDGDDQVAYQAWAHCMSLPFIPDHRRQEFCDLTALGVKP